MIGWLLCGGGVGLPKQAVSCVIVRTVMRKGIDIK